ncbi:uncharacterized protein LOC124283284 isoform X1 [Haliotis rubra]|uniref:uncharacterized protein LOC124283284 isoform X1 n=1 Tax=Haliotis rubra TaxID=36100 RepID=UPI001EE60166|nr:uncharacterized protein LOC124283284 isoform X1 [Haliotis rubra]
MVRNGNIVDYYCAAGFSMTSGSLRATCVNPNTWYPDTPPVCTVIKTTPDDVVPLWVPITCAILLSLIAATCLALACYYCCCRGRCCANYNRIRASTASIHDDGYYDNKGHYGNQQYKGDGYYYDDRYTYRKSEPGRNHDGPYIIPVSNRQHQYPLNRSYVEYVTREPQKQKPKPYSHIPSKVRTTPTSTTPRVDVVHVVQLTNGQLVPMDKYLREHPGARLETLGDRDVVYSPTNKTENKPRLAWKTNVSSNKKTPPPPVVASRDSNSTDPVVVTVMNDLNYNHPEKEKDKKPKAASKKIPLQPQQPSHVIGINTQAGAARRPREEDVKPPRERKDKSTKEVEENNSKVGNDHHPDNDTKDDRGSKRDDDDDSGINNESEPGEPIRAQYVRSGSTLDFDLDLEDNNTPPHGTRPEFKRHAFAVLDHNRTKRAREFPAWRPHANPVRNINTSTQ